MHAFEIDQPFFPNRLIVSGPEVVEWSGAGPDMADET